MEVLELEQKIKLTFLTYEPICGQGQTSCFVFVNLIEKVITEG